MIKFQFDSNQGFQKEAINSIVDIFKGQEIKSSSFTALTHTDVFGEVRELGIANKLNLSHDDLFKNVLAVQDEHHLTRSKDIKDENYKVPNFAIEMETGTGKTYVYTRTIFEMNKKYGFSKFIIVVPSVAIREGVKKSLENTEEHFRKLYPGQHLHSFIYNSSRLTEVKDFATSDAIEVMIINIDAFRKSFTNIEKDTKVNLIHRETNKLQDRRPIEFIQETRPVVIIDEPQSVDGTTKSKEAIQSLNPLCVLRYSATHKDEHSLMYRLGPVEAHERRLVKRIEVLPVEGADKGNDAYIKLVSVSERGGSYSAKIEMDVLVGGISKTKTITVNPNNKNDLYLLSGEQDKYKGYILVGINCTPGHEYIEFESGDILQLKQVIGGVDDDLVKRAQIKYTIETHLEKEIMHLDKDIKILSLFFLDKVSNYREYNEDGSVSKGKYAKMFEEEYLKLIKLPKYSQLFTADKSKKYALNENVDEVHDGYFAVDKKVVTPFEARSEKTKSGAEDSTYNLIMKDKERLLSFETNLRFIFSHSALKEGWDNPNIFQICTLVDTQDTMTKRQKIGRGLRLPVNQKGDRIHDEQVNILTVIANESYEQFAETLQNEIEADTNTRFGVIEQRQFENILLDGKELGYDKSDKIYNYLLEQEYINKKGKVLKTLKEALAEEKFEVPEEFKQVKGEIEEVIKQVVKKLPLLNKNDKVILKLNKQVYLNEEFKNLWDKIKYKTTYRVDFDQDKLVEQCVNEIATGMKKLTPSAIIAKWVNIDVTRKGVMTGDPKKLRNMIVSEYDNNLPDILRFLESQTGLKRSTLVDILVKSKRLEDIYINPQEFMELVAQIINNKKRNLIVDGIKYEKIGDNEYFTQELFDTEELIGYLNSNTIKVEKSVYDHVIYDSTTVEKVFTERLENDQDVKLYVKLPGWFKIETPLGSYNPDWAVLIDKNGEEKLYFVVETKGSTSKLDLRLLEDSKIRCGRKHFESLDSGIKYELASDYDEWRGTV